LAKTADERVSGVVGGGKGAASQSLQNFFPLRVARIFGEGQRTDRTKTVFLTPWNYASFF
jgi:hypothetical protein